MTPEAALPVQEKLAEAAPGEILNAPRAGEAEANPFLRYLSTAEGHQAISRVLGIFENIQQSNINSANDQRKQNVQFQQNIILTWQVIAAVIILTTVIASVWLAAHDKLSAAISGFFGLIVGYLLGRREHS